MTRSPASLVPLILLLLVPSLTPAQGFSSASSAPASAAPTATTAPFTVGTDAAGPPAPTAPAITTASFAVGTDAAGPPAPLAPAAVTAPFGDAAAPVAVRAASATTTPVQELPAPAAQVAALGFSSISGMSGADAQSAAGQPGRAGSNRPYELADKVIVYKGDRVLQLLRGSRVIAEYPIKLGLNPYGHKRQEGDFRTPEGRYTLVRRNPESEFFLSIQVSYPNQEDAAVARERGVSPGGLIMIHGQPNVPKKPPEYYATRDWTDGCIALSNADMTDVWLRTPLGIPIEIRP